jgi:hypothetical protein
MKHLMARPTSPAHPEIAALQALMQPIQDGLDDVIALIRTQRRALVPNALLNIAIERVLMREGTVVTARILRRLADLI